MIFKIYNVKSKLLKCINSSKFEKVPKIKGIISTIFDRISYIIVIIQLFFFNSTKKKYGVISDVIISLTTFPKRIQTVHITIFSLINQTYKPSRIILWLAKEEFPSEETLPKALIELKKHGLEIRYCDNIKPHKKYYYTMQENPESIVITCDDDVIYPENLVEELLKFHDKFPNSIICNRGHIMKYDSNGFYPYNQWIFNPNIPSIPRMDLCPTGISGVLYPPNSLHKNVFNKKDIVELCLNADDLWLKAMSSYKGTSIVKTDCFVETFPQIPNTDKVGLTKTNVDKSQNDIQLMNIMSKYNFLNYIK